MSLERHRTLAGPQITRQPKHHLNKIRVGNRTHDFRWYIEYLVVPVNQIDCNSRGSFTRDQLKILNENNHAGILISQEIEEVWTNNGKWISDESY